MLKLRVIPSLLVKEGSLVKGVGFHSWRRIGTLLPALKVYNTRQVDELFVVDVDATLNGRDPMFDVVNDCSAECFVPLTVGGGIRSLEHIHGLLRAGADKVAVNSAAYTSPDLIVSGARRFGSQCIVASIDAKKEHDGSYQCYAGSGTVATGRTPAGWAQEMASLGAGEIMITSIDRDGTMKGYDLDLIRMVTSAVDIPVIASGGAGRFEDLHEAVKAGASAVAAASMFHFTEQTPLGAKDYLKSCGVAVRDVNRASQ